VTSALWHYSEESAQWQLVLASPLKDRIGSIQMYTLIQSVIQNASLEDNLSLDNILVVSPNYEVVTRLLNALQGTPLRGELNTGDSYIYRLEGSRRTPLTKFNARSNAARHRDTIQKRIDRLKEFLSDFSDNDPQVDGLKQQISFLEERRREFDAIANEK
jgi:hypothetical protein